MKRKEEEKKKRKRKEKMLRLIVGALLIFFLPGFTLVRAVFPRKGALDREYDIVYQITLGLGLSVVITVLVALFLFSLGLQSFSKGYYTSTNIWVMHSTLTILFFIIGWYRGAYPGLGRIHPKLYRIPKTEENDTNQLLELRRVYQLQLEKCEEKMMSSRLRAHYAKKKKDIEKKISEIDRKVGDA